MANIVLCRIDSRLIHGQVMTKWVNQSKANRIVVVSDELAEDDFMKSIYLLSAPVGIKVDCYSEAETIKSFQEDKLGSGNVLLLLPSLVSMEKIYDQGVHVSDLQIGGLGGAPNRKVVFQNITLDEVDVRILSKLKDAGVKIVFQTIPEDKPQSVEAMIQKFNS